MSDEDIIDEMIEHLIMHSPRLSGYTIKPAWDDKPDRVLEHTNDVPIGIEATELFPKSTKPQLDSVIGENKDHKRSSEVVQAYMRWKHVLFKRVWPMTGEHPSSRELRKLSMRFVGLNYVHRSSEDEELAKQILCLMLYSKPLKKSSLRTASPYRNWNNQALDAYPLIKRIVDSVCVWKNNDRVAWYSPCDGLSPSPEWFRESLEWASQQKSKKAMQYRKGLKTLQRGENAELHLFMYSRNSWPPCMPVLVSVKQAYEYAPIFQDSGFDVVWYDNRIPDGSTGDISPACQLYPAPLQDDGSRLKVQACGGTDLEPVT